MLRNEADMLRAQLLTATNDLSQAKSETAAARKAAEASADLARSTKSSSSSSSSAAVAPAPAPAFDIDTYRAERLAATQPNIIEVSPASQPANQLERPPFFYDPCFWRRLKASPGDGGERNRSGTVPSVGCAQMIAIFMINNCLNALVAAEPQQCDTRRA
jgi:hypothetical protein